jgi:hypothetical protein
VRRAAGVAVDLGSAFGDDVDSGQAIADADIPVLRQWVVPWSKVTPAQG